MISTDIVDGVTFGDLLDNTCMFNVYPSLGPIDISDQEPRSIAM